MATKNRSRAIKAIVASLALAALSWSGVMSAWTRTETFGPSNTISFATMGVRYSFDTSDGTVATGTWAAMDGGTVPLPASLSTINPTVASQSFVVAFRNTSTRPVQLQGVPDQNGNRATLASASGTLASCLTFALNHGTTLATQSGTFQFNNPTVAPNAYAYLKVTMTVSSAPSCVGATGNLTLTVTFL